MTALLQSTDLVGVVHTLYCILLHSFLPESASQSQEPYGPGVIQVALQGIRFLNSFALLDLSAFQVLIINPNYIMFSLVTNLKKKSLDQANLCVDDGGLGIYFSIFLSFLHLHLHLHSHSKYIVLGGE